MWPCGRIFRQAANSNTANTKPQFSDHFGVQTDASHDHIISENDHGTWCFITSSLISLCPFNFLLLTAYNDVDRATIFENSTCAKRNRLYPPCKDNPISSNTYRKCYIDVYLYHTSYIDNIFNIRSKRVKWSKKATRKPSSILDSGNKVQSLSDYLDK